MNSNTDDESLPGEKQVDHRPDGEKVPISSRLRSAWLVISTVALLLVVVLVLYFVIDPNFEKFGSAGNDESATVSTKSRVYHESSDLCGTLDFQHYEESMDVTVKKESGDPSCDFRFTRNGNKLRLYTLVVEVSVVNDRSEAKDAYKWYRTEATREAKDEVDVAGPWEQSLLTASDKPYSSYDLVVQDENLAFHLIQTYDPDQPLKQDTVRELLTDFARQIQQTLTR